MTPLKLKTNKLFYGKWPYKITTKVDGCYVFRRWNFHLDFIEKTYFGSITSKIQHGFDKKKLRKFFNAVAHLEGKEFQFRIDNNVMSFYLKDEELYELTATNLGEFVIHLTEPENSKELEVIVDDKKIVLCNKYPHTRYKYRVFLTNLNQNTKENFGNWLKNSKTKSIKLPDSLRRYFNNKENRYLYTNNYFYVEDEKTLLMVQLLVGTNIKVIG